MTLRGVDLDGMVEAFDRVIEAQHAGDRTHDPERELDSGTEDVPF